MEQLAYQPPQQLPSFAQDKPLDTLIQEDRDRTRNPLSWSSKSEKPTMAIARGLVAEALDDEEAEVTPPIAANGGHARASIAAWTIAAACALIAVGEGVWIGRVELRRAVAPPQPIVLDSLEQGDSVLVDGREIGVTPLKLALTPDVRSIRVRTRPVVEIPDAQPIPVVDPPTDAGVSATLKQAAAREHLGGLRLSSSIELQVLEGERVLGSSADGPVVTAAGRHELDFVNSALGYRSHQVVEIKAGQIIPLRISPPDGRVSVNAVPWAQVSINGSSVGETPLANIPLPVGEYEITFRHPQLGERKQKVVVKSNVVTRVSATFEGH
jgi:hypothetical protein